MKLTPDKLSPRNAAISGIMFGLLLNLFFAPAYGQYFGRNKVQYEKFDYQILKTEHFDLYFYPEESAAVRVAAQMAERWYKRYSRLLNHELRGRQPLVMYASHPQFEQTTVLPEVMSEGTGGVTESAKRRIILPFGGTLADTDHVIGHELVHAFQYDIAAAAGPRYGNSQNGGGIERAPLWFIEGLAEYLSIGPVDSLTAMWMRDMIRKKKLPTIKDLRDPYKYFPYRYGQALWAYIGGRYGDLTVAKLMRDVCRGIDYEVALEKTLNVKLDQLSKDWQEALKKDYTPVLESTQVPAKLGRIVERGTETDPYNVAPVVSPDGKSFIFISSHDLFAIEMFMGDTKTGKITKKLTKTAVDSHFQSIQFINSAGSWNADGSRFVFGAVTEGKPELAFLDAEGRRIVDEIKFPTLGEILNPTFSPDGKKIAFSALAGGYTDIYIYDVEAKKLENMTDDPFGDIHPAWSPDGRWIVFVTERFSSQLATNGMLIGNYDLALLDPATGDIKKLDVLPGAKKINPQWAPDSKSIYFVSDRNGISNIYRASLDSRAVSMVTNLYTGVSGISNLSPSISVAAKTNDLYYSAYDEGGFSIYALEPKELLVGTPVSDEPEAGLPAVLPPKDRQGSEILGLIKNSGYGLPDSSKFSTAPYKPKLSLDYVMPPTVGVGYDPYYGAYGGGGLAAYWSDMMGWHNLMVMANVSSRLMDSQAMVAYQNSKSRFNWGAVLQRMPLVYGDYAESFDGSNIVEQEILYRQIYYQAGVFGSYPFSTFSRVELSTGYNYIQFNNVIYTSVYDYYTGQALVVDSRTDLPSPPGIQMGYVGAALVYDSSIFGATAPIIGQSYRLEVSPSFGTLNYYSVTADFRKYIVPVKPFTLAFRVMHYGRYGSGADDSRLYPMYLGYDMLVRGYDYESFTADEATNGTFNIDRLFGTKIAVANVELRFPLFGLLGLGKGYYGIFPLDFVAFYDAGLAWGRSLYSDNKPWFVSGGNPDWKPLTSAGVGVRVNLFGYIVLGVNYVKPFQRLDANGKAVPAYFQFSFYPGF
jgi:Tol biopolymer transport system component